MTIDVVLNPLNIPLEFDSYPDFFVVKELNKAGIPFFGRSLKEGPSAGSIVKTVLEDGRTLYRWSSAQ